MNKLAIAFVLSVSFCMAQSKKKSGVRYADGKELIKAMHKMYAPDKWYKYFTFSQNMEFYRNDSIVRTDVWHEAYAPGSLIIKFGKKDSKDGVLFSNFKVNSFSLGNEPKSAARVHDLLLVGLDVYFFMPEHTCKILDSLGYDLTKIREDQFEGRNVFVVGAQKGDSTSKQFWIDAERLYMHRIIYDQKGKVNDVVFGDYTKLENYWMAKTITFKTNGKLGLIERYYDIKFPKSLPTDWFDPRKFNDVVLE